MGPALLIMTNKCAPRVNSCATCAEQAAAVLNSGTAALRALLSDAATDARSCWFRKRTHFWVKFVGVPLRDASRGARQARTRRRSA
jgi:hypothetical protein